MAAEFKIEILSDGKISIETGDMSGQHHQSADEFLQFLSELMTGPCETKSTRAGTHHGQGKGLTHSHGGSGEHTH